RNSALGRPTFGPIKLTFSVTWWPRTDSDEPAALDHHGRRDHVGAAEIQAERFDDDPRRGGDQDDRRARAAELVQVLDHPLVEPGPHELDEVIIGDPFQLHDRDPRDALEPEGDEPAVVEPAEAVLEAVIDGAEDE